MRLRLRLRRWGVGFWEFDGIQLMFEFQFTVIGSGFVLRGLRVFFWWAFCVCICCFFGIFHGLGVTWTCVFRRHIYPVGFFLFFFFLFLMFL
jgi:hypothetical protein